MGKMTARNYDSEKSHERIKKKKRKKDLEELRRNALVTKRNLISRAPAPQNSKSSFMKTLSEFSTNRTEIENAVQSQDTLIFKSKYFNEEELMKPLKTKGFFLGGIKGKQLTRPLTTQEKKLKNAILNADALKLMQSGAYDYSKLEESKKKNVEDNIESQIQMNVSKLFEDSSESSSCTNGLGSIEKLVQSSPILGGIKRNNLVRSHAETKIKNYFKPNNHSPLIKYFTKEEKCKRRLFEDENPNVNNKNIECAKNNYDKTESIRFSPRKSTPENVIFFTDRIPYKDVDNKLNKKQNNQKRNPVNSHLIKYYIQICKTIAEKDLKNIFRHNIKDPMEITKAALRNTYTNAFKEYIQRQKSLSNEQKSHLVDSPSVSSNSEILMEPDSAIARAVKKHSSIKIKKPMWITKNNSDVTEHNVDDTEIDFSPLFLTAENLKKKQMYSSKGEHSDAEIPSSTKVNADPESAKVELKMDCIHPDRQELIARYLKDVDTNNKLEKDRNIFDDQGNVEKEFNSQYSEKEKFFSNDNVKNNYLVQKSGKHIPAILRKNRPSIDCITKEKILLNVEKYPKMGEIINKASISDFNSDSSLKSERTPNFGNSVSNQLIEAPKCKYMYMNAKYNQPSRINVPLIQNKRFQRNVPSEKHLFSSPNKVENHFITDQSFPLSPIKEQIHFMPNKQHIHRCQISQETSEKGKNCMTRMISFGDIQERANRLTLCSSQSQNCSQESIEQVYSSQEEHSSLQPNFYYQQCKPSKNHLSYNNRPCMAYKEIPTEKKRNTTFNSNYDYHLHNVIKYKEKAPCITKSNFEIVQPENYPFQRNETVNSCLVNDCQMCRNQSIQQHNQVSVINSIPVQQPGVCQPVKFIAIEENRMPQRRPIYNSSDNNSCPFKHKTSISNQQFTTVMKPCYTRNTSNQQQCTMPSIQFQPQVISQSGISSDFKYDNLHKVSSLITTQKLANFNNEISRLNRKSAVNFVPNNISNQSFIAEHNVPRCTTMNNQNYIKHHIQTEMSSPLYSQVGYQHNHCNKNEDYKINNDYELQMNHFIHSKRS